jgi:hypothetical protein
MRFMLTLAVALLILGASGAARADPDPALAQFAGAQLAMAEAALERASAALRANEHASARRLAAQAGLDARLAWSMTSSQVLRNAAVEVSRRAERLRWRGVMAAGAPVRPAP